MSAPSRRVRAAKWSEVPQILYNLLVEVSASRRLLQDLVAAQRKADKARVVWKP